MAGVLDLRDIFSWSLTVSMRERLRNNSLSKRGRSLAWSAKGSKALAILKVVELNGRWQALWFSPQTDATVAA
jgi:hypothetical protein